ncbi:MAG: 23S rRNA (adenine(2503)-C(2))-methyltransferase RlmN [Bacteroidales bacterium]
MVKKSLCGSTADEILDLIEPLGYSRAHAVSISNSIYKKAVSDINNFEKIPIRLREKLLNIAIDGIFFPQASAVSTDKSVKYLFSTESGKEFETVYIPDKKRNTVCVSTQSGCKMGCSFCFTGRYGFRGNLTAGEIVNQIIALPQADRVTHVVFMGMGEPMDNLGNVLKACRIITAEWGLALSARNVTISTVGIMPGVDQFLKRSDCNLTLSLFSPFSEERKKMIPVENKYPVQEIINMMKNFPVKKKRRLSLAYVMIKDLNDTDYHLTELKSMLKGSEIRINLLSYHSGLNDQYCSSSGERMYLFKHNLIISGISASIRKSRGEDISAACGLLAAGLKQ